MIQDLDSREDFEKAINGPHAVVLAFSDVDNCPVKILMVEGVVSDVTTKIGVTGYRIDPKIAGIPATINTGTFQVYHHGQMIREEHVTSMTDLKVLEDLIQFAKDQS